MESYGFSFLYCCSFEMLYNRLNIAENELRIDLFTSQQLYGHMSRCNINFIEFLMPFFLFDAVCMGPPVIIILQKKVSIIFFFKVDHRNESRKVTYT